MAAQAASKAQTKPRTSTPGHGGARPGSGRKPKTEQNDAYTLIAKARAKHEAFKANLAEVEYRKAIGELVSAADVEKAWADQIQIAKGRLLTLPARVSSAVLTAKTLRDIETVITEHVHEILTELANGGYKQNRNDLR